MITESQLRKVNELDKNILNITHLIKSLEGNEENGQLMGPYKWYKKHGSVNPYPLDRDEIISFHSKYKKLSIEITRSFIYRLKQERHKLKLKRKKYIGE